MIHVFKQISVTSLIIGTKAQRKSAKKNGLIALHKAPLGKKSATRIGIHKQNKL